MNVDVVQRITSDNNERITQTREHRAHLRNADIVTLEHEHHFEGGSGVESVAVGFAKRSRFGLDARDCDGGPLAGEGLHHRVEKHDETSTTGINHTRPPQRLELLGCACECAASAIGRRHNHSSQVVGICCTGTGCCLTRDREDRALNRPVNSGIGEFGCASERSGDGGAANSVRPCGREFVGHAAQQLRQDHPGISSGP